MRVKTKLIPQKIDNFEIISFWGSGNTVRVNFRVVKW